VAYKINEDCIGCGACIPECKNKAIREGDTIHRIDPEACTECVGWSASPQCSEVCPVGACVPDLAPPESREALLDKWKRLHPGETPAVS
jgi:ferredoxin